MEYVIYVKILESRKVIKKEVEEFLKRRVPTVQIQRMWNINTKVLPVITGTT